MKVVVIHVRRLQTVGSRLDHRAIEYSSAEVCDDDRRRMLQQNLLTPFLEAREKESGSRRDRTQLDHATRAARCRARRTRRRRRSSFADRPSRTPSWRVRCPSPNGGFISTVSNFFSATLSSATPCAASSAKSRRRVFVAPAFLAHEAIERGADALLGRREQVSGLPALRADARRAARRAARAPCRPRGSATRPAT